MPGLKDPGGDWVGGKFLGRCVTYFFDYFFLLNTASKWKNLEIREIWKSGRYLKRYHYTTLRNELTHIKFMDHNT